MRALGAEIAVLFVDELDSCSLSGWLWSWNDGRSPKRRYNVDPKINESVSTPASTSLALRVVGRGILPIFGQLVALAACGRQLMWNAN